MAKGLRNIWKSLFYGVLIMPYRLYVRKNRTLQIDGIKIEVPPSVFHPTVFFSTQFLKSYLKNESITGRKVLELGAGTGFLSVFMAKNGADVWASDINPIACQTVQTNGINNGVNVAVIHSDLFTEFPVIQFDLIVINPPYYPRNPQNDTEMAFFCGENFEYFHKLFSQMASYLTTEGKAIMVLSEDCEISKISQIAINQGFVWEEIQRERKVEWNFLFEIKQNVNQYITNAQSQDLSAA